MERIRGEVTGRRVGDGGSVTTARLQKIIRWKQLSDFVGLRKTVIEDAIRAGTFPRPIKLGIRAVGWLEDDLIKWQQERIAASQSE